MGKQKCTYWKHKTILIWCILIVMVFQMFLFCWWFCTIFFARRSAQEGDSRKISEVQSSSWAISCILREPPVNSESIDAKINFIWFFYDLLMIFDRKLVAIRGSRSCENRNCKGEKPTFFLRILMNSWWCFWLCWWRISAKLWSWGILRRTRDARDDSELIGAVINWIQDV